MTLVLSASGPCLIFQQSWRPSSPFTLISMMTSSGLKSESTYSASESETADSTTNPCCWSLRSMSISRSMSSSTTKIFTPFFCIKQQLKQLHNPAGRYGQQQFSVGTEDNFYGWRIVGKG